MKRTNCVTTLIEICSRTAIELLCLYLGMNKDMGAV